MTKEDYLWPVALLAFSSIFLVPAGREAYVSVNTVHPYLMGFIKFAVLATMGELLAIRIAAGKWNPPPGVIIRAFIWGGFGMIIVLMFEIFSSGVIGAIAKGLVWAGEGFFSRIAIAFWISAIMNLVFAPTFMTLHRITDTYIDLAYAESIPLSKIKLSDVIAKIDWQGVVSFIVLKTIPFFWIPAHTLVFLLPAEFRILISAYLSVALGAILAYGKRRKRAGSNQISLNT